VYKKNVASSSFPRAAYAAVLRCAVAALPLLGALAIAPTGVGGAAIAAAAATPRPAILSIKVSTPKGFPLPASGARVVVSVHVRNATKCTFLRQRRAFSSLYPLKTVRCASGHAKVTVPPIGNVYKAPVHLTYAVRAYGAGSRSVQRSVKVAQAAAASKPSPTTTKPTASLSLSSSSVPWTGGSVVLSYSSSNATSCSLSSTPAFEASSNPLSVACNGTYSANVPPSTSQQSWTFTFTAENASGTASSSQTLTELGARTSPSWSGYVVPSSSALVTNVSGQWTVPTLNCAVTPNADGSIWVGIGGFGWPTGGSSGTLLQTGIGMHCANGSPQYDGWFEEFPSIPNHSEVFTGFPVSAGDSIEASVYQGSNGNWVTRVDDLTTGLSGWMITGEAWGVGSDSGSTFSDQGSTAGLSYSGGYTAEWIVEAPTVQGSVASLVDYGSVSFGNLRTSLPSWSLTADESEAIEQNGTVVSTPSPPGTDGFSVSYTG
jgi:hypothetical protein